MSEALLQVRGISKSFGHTRALDDVTLTARRGEVHAVLGENGAGKSTLMKILAGALARDAGDIELAGMAFAPDNPTDARAAGISIVYQEPQLCAHLSVAENIMLGSEPTRFGVVDRRAVKQRAEDAIARVMPGEQRLSPEVLVGELSTGDRQMVAIARALSQIGDASAGVLILDEPTSSLTSHDTERLFEAVAQLRERGLCILYISHFLEEVERIADRYTVLRDGKSVGDGSIADTSMSDVVTLMVGEDMGELFSRSAHERGELLLELDDLAGYRQPASCSLRLHRGEVLGVAGLVGSGRTEMLRAIFGLDAVKSGKLVVGSYKGPASPARRLAQGVGLLSEDRKGEGLAASMSIADNLTLSKLFNLGPVGLLSPARKRAAAQQWIDRLGVRCESPEQTVADLSGGNQQKVALARLLYHDVDVLLLDEPTRGVDVRSRAEVYRVIDELASRGKAVLMVSSYLPELFMVCDRIAVMRRGRLGEARPVSELDPHGVLMEATGA